MAKKKSKNGLDVDLYVSQRIRERRILLGLTQRGMAELIGVVYQQVQNYETGVDRISAGRLFQIACVLSVPVEYFFDGLEAGDPADVHKHPWAISRIARAFTTIENLQHREALAHLVRALAQG
jgi:transcriptional regulator with XRE-family HTH domain